MLGVVSKRSQARVSETQAPDVGLVGRMTLSGCMIARVTRVPSVAVTVPGTYVVAEVGTAKVPTEADETKAAGAGAACGSTLQAGQDVGSKNSRQHGQKCEAKHRENGEQEGAGMNAD